MSASNEQNSVSVVVNYFNPNGDSRVEAMTELALRTLGVFTSGGLQVVLADGSGKSSKRLGCLCEKSGWEYLPSETKEAFAVTYNRGMRRASCYYRVWMASDIFVAPQWNVRLIAEMKRTGASIACPLLSTCDYPGQVRDFVVSRRTFVPSCMTFNLNIITEDAFNIIGEIDEAYSGCFNDLDYLLRARKKGKVVIVVDAGNICHLALGTRLSSSSVNYHSDKEIFRDKHPEVNFTDWADINISILIQSRSLFWLRNALLHFPVGRVSRSILSMVDRFEPIFHRI